VPRRKPTSDVASALRRHVVAHGLAGDVPVIEGVESPAEWQAHRAAVIADWQPSGAMETEYADRIARLTWRLRRVDRFEVDSITVARERVEFDFARARRWDGRPSSVEEARAQADQAARIVRMVQRLTRVAPDTRLPGADVERFLDELARDAELDLDDILDALHEAEAAALEADDGGNDAASADDLMRAGAAVSEGEAAGPATPTGSAARGAGAAAVAEPDGEAIDNDVLSRPAHAAIRWTATRLITVLRALAADDAAAFEDAMRAFVTRARALAAGAEREAAEARDEIDRMRRERLLPGAREMDLIIRYESALNRMLYQAINQLESAQARRNGAPVALPLRLQHYGGRNG
jgi:hypothetical protein